MIRAALALTTALALTSAANAQTVDLKRYRMVDLTHQLNAKTLYWPTSPTTFKLDQLSFGPTPGGWFIRRTRFRPRNTAARISTRRSILGKATCRWTECRSRS